MKLLIALLLGFLSLAAVPSAARAETLPGLPGIPGESEWGIALMESAGIGGVSCASCGVTDKAVNHLRIGALLGIRGPWLGFGSLLGLYAETGVGRQLGGASILGDRSSLLENSGYGVGLLVRRWKFFGFGTLILVGDYKLTASSSESTSSSTAPGNVKFDTPFGIKVGGGVELTSALHVLASFARTRYSNLSYVDPTTRTGVTSDLSSAPLVESVWGVGLSVLF